MWCGSLQLLCTIVRQTTIVFCQWYWYIIPCIGEKQVESVSQCNTKNDPPLLWSDGERERLLSGMGVDQLVNKDIELIAIDYHTIAEPFMRRHPDIYGPCKVLIRCRMFLVRRLPFIRQDCIRPIQKQHIFQDCGHLWPFTGESCLLNNA